MKRKRNDMRSMVLAACLLSVFAWGQEERCSYRVKDIAIGWEAFKTPMKTGVKGGFGTIKLSARPDESIDDLLEGAKVVVETSGIDSKNRARDAKIVKFFFNTQNVKTITAQIVAVKEDSVDVNVTMNGITRTVPMRLDRTEENISAKGVIDLGDFKMLPSLSSLNEACYDPHEGKTWQDVEVSFAIKTAKRCR